MALENEKMAINNDKNTEKSICGSAKKIPMFIRQMKAHKID